MNTNTEFWKQFAASMFRKLLTTVGALLAAHGWISSEQADGLSSLAIVEYLVSALFFVAPVIWAWAKVKFNVEVVRDARRADAATPISVIKTETLSKHSLISSV